MDLPWLLSSACRPVWLAGTSLVCVLATACQPEATKPPEDLASGQLPNVQMRLGAGDELEVRVYGEADMSGPFQVQDDGSLDFPLIGRLAVAGLTQSEVAALLTERLSDGYLVSPSVTVRVTARQNVEVTVFGAVQRAGSFRWVTGLTLAQAVSLAGGLTPVAAPRKVRVTRQSATGPVTFEISVKAIAEGRADDVALQPGDIVFVPESAI